MVYGQDLMGPPAPTKTRRDMILTFLTILIASGIVALFVALVVANL